MELYLVAAVVVAVLAAALLVWQRAHYLRRLRRAKLIPPKKEEADRTCRRRIADALAELKEYELGHVARQAQRLEKQRRVGLPHQRKRPDGEYDPDQRREHVLIVVRDVYARAGHPAPEQLERFIREAVPDEE